MGNRSGGDGENNEHVDIITSPRSTGSLLKPLLYASLLEAGMVDESEKGEALATIVQQAKRIGEVVKRLRKIEQPRSVEYLGDARMLDISPDPTRKP